MKIWQRLVLSILLAVIASGSGLIYWASLEQQRIAADQAREFADSIHQMTLAGLTGMMITGTVPLRSLFLDQIKAMHQIESLKVIRGDAVVGQFGPGLEGETDADAVERAVLEGREAYYAVEAGSDGVERLRAVIPARALENYLGKTCTNCHNVPVGTVLGAVSMEISLASAGESTRRFTRHAILAAAALCFPLGGFIWYFISRLVSRPLARMADGLEDIAAGDIDAAVELPVRREDEVGRAVAAFNRVLGKAAELLREQRLARIVFENSLEGITVTDAHSRIVMVNKAFTDTTGYSAEEALGKTPAMLKSGKQGDNFYRDFWNILRERGEWRGEIWNRRKNGTVYPEWLNVSAVRDRHGRIEHYIAIFSDITERKEHEERITYQAFHDALTGLPNRLLFRDRLDLALAQARRNKARKPALMFLDLDRFKQINDTLGHEAGDTLLKEVANRLRHCVRASDTVARMAGDEFTVLLPEAEEEGEARAVADKILQVMNEPIVLGSESRVVTTSIGISHFPQDGRDAETLMKHADAAMYAVKGSGRASFCFFNSDLLGRPTRRSAMEERLVNAYERNEFRVAFQAATLLDKGQPYGLEARLTWEQPDGTLLDCEEFLGAAEDLGLAPALAECLLENACREALALGAGTATHLAVDLGTAAFGRSDLAERIALILERTGWPAGQLEIGFPESIVMRNPEESRAVLASLARLGVGLALTDYGVGGSSLVLLRDLPLDTLRLDAALVGEERRRPGDSPMLAAILGLAKALGLKVVVSPGKAGGLAEGQAQHPSP
jgi:diguanylate cyclase (GGDEF)-like protein/PAS domain S-box-containing protein